jgi:hypothetical protein
MTIFALAAALLFQAAAPATAAGPMLAMPGFQDRPITAAYLLGKHRMDVRIDDVEGNTTVYHGAPLLAVLEDHGLEAKTMAGERKTAAQVVVVTARDGYTVVFSVGELLAMRGAPRVYLVSETAAGPLPPEQGPVRLVVLGDRVRSSYALARVELRPIASNPGARATPQRG